MEVFAQQVKSLLGVSLSSAQLSAFAAYERMLLDWNERFNLTAIRSPQEVRTKHFLDSLTCLQAMRNTPTDQVIDVGTGAGFPGIPLKIVCPAMHLILVESVGKKADFCRAVVDQLKLSGVEVLTERAEVLGQMEAHRERYHWALARAVAKMPVLAEYLLPLVKVGGAMLAMKGENAPAETHSGERSFHLLGGHLRQLIPITLPGVAEERYLVVIQKTAATPPGYPRRIGLPAKKPLH